MGARRLGGVPTASLSGITDRGVEAPPGLVVEVLSPHSQRIDRELKPPRYRAFGVPEYWVVDPASRSVEVHRANASSSPDTVIETLRWQPNVAYPAMTIEVGPLFDAS